ncbi:unnamed protein product [Acanthosepion pharaonis]|uniref:B box-type domain-containing protein n=1 Tax=Acanthosepion pharaonis TaxID=158019 RepID=A0A812CPA2_ACAPH|nr:unnamed protein product [Sepia pharaonis]
MFISIYLSIYLSIFEIFFQMIKCRELFERKRKNSPLSHRSMFSLLLLSFPPLSLIYKHVKKVTCPDGFAFRKFNRQDVFYFRLASFHPKSENQNQILFLSSEISRWRPMRVKKRYSNARNATISWTWHRRHCHVFILSAGRVPVTDDELRLAPFLVKSLRRHHLESSEWKCDFCSEDGVQSAGQIWCKDCEKFLCQNCNRIHKRLELTHNWEDLSGVSRGEAIRVITTDDCRQHHKCKDAFCDRCNVCLCDACYENHVTASPQCPPRPLSVREKASKEKESGPTLEQQLRQFEIHIRATNEQTRRSIDQLSTDCDSECSKLWQDFETFVEKARIKLGELCDNMREAASEQKRQWRLFLKEREDLLGKVKIWSDTLRHLLTDDADDEDVVSGLRLYRAELSAWLRQSFAPLEKIRWVVTFPKWCHDSLELLKKEMIDFTLETSGHLQLKRQCCLQDSKPLWISSIITDDKDNHVFVCHWNGESIQEFTETGVLVGQFRLTDGGEGFCPWDMCRLSDDILVVSCPRGFFFSFSLSVFFLLFLFFSFFSFSLIFFLFSFLCFSFFFFNIFFVSLLFLHFKIFFLLFFSFSFSIFTSFFFFCRFLYLSGALLGISGSVSITFLFTRTLQRA